MKKKASRGIAWKLFSGLLIALILVMAGIRVSEWWMERQAGFVRFDAFGIEIPTDYIIHGIDVSRYQQVINWESVQKMEVEDIRIGFAFIKATEGIKNVDRHFHRNWKRSRMAGITRGAYHFFLATKSGRSQAENFISTVELEPGDLPPVLDIELTYGSSKRQLRERALEWLKIVEQHYGVKPIIYTNVDFYKQHLGDEFDEYPLWVAHYLQKKQPRIYRDWKFWQHSETGRVSGIRGKVDFNVFKGDSSEFRMMLITDELQQGR